MGIIIKPLVTEKMTAITDKAPHINRKSLNSVHTEKKCAVGNLFADARNFQMCIRDRL